MIRHNPFLNGRGHAAQHNAWNRGHNDGVINTLAVTGAAGLALTIIGQYISYLFNNGCNQLRNQCRNDVVTCADLSDRLALIRLDKNLSNEAVAVEEELTTAFESCTKTRDACKKNLKEKCNLFIVDR